MTARRRTATSRKVPAWGWWFLGGMVVAFALSALLVKVLPSVGPPLPIEEPDILRRCHEVLKRSQRDYGLRLTSLQRLREEGLAHGNPLAVEDELLTAARTLLATFEGREAPQEAARRLAAMAPRVAAICNKAGIVLGPAITPELIRARFLSEEDQRSLGSILAEYYFAELLRSLVQSASAPPDDTLPPQPSPAGAKHKL